MPPGSMLERPIFVHWCVSCGREAPEDARSCPRCSGLVRRHQRVLELPDEEAGPLSLASLRAALADVLAGEDVGGSAMLLAQQGPDPGVAAAHPTLASALVELGVPPAVQRALVGRGFQSLDQITAAAMAAPGDGSLALQLGLSPAAEILLRRLRHGSSERDAAARRDLQRRRLATEASAAAAPMSSCGMQIGDSDTDAASEAECDLAAAKRLRAPDGCDGALESEDVMA